MMFQAAATLKHTADEMYSAQPDATLYHYTSLKGLLGIVESGAMYASEIRYFNDAAEMRHASGLLVRAAGNRATESEKRRSLLEQFSKWVSDRLVAGHMLYVACFTANGNLLSQWRGYCPPGQGISIGFAPEKLLLAARQQSFSVGACVYDTAIQERIINQILDSIEALADEMGENIDGSKRHPLNSFHDVFESVETDLLRIAVLLKHPSFREEHEWRVVSAVITRYSNQGIAYRDGVSMLIPYVPFKLPEADVPSDESGLGMERVYVRPTPHPNLSMNSVSGLLSTHRARVRDGLHNCGIPFRTV